MKVLVLGSDGFVGRNLMEDLSPNFNCFGSTRKVEKLAGKNNLIVFDLDDQSTWNNVRDIEPDCIINCIVSGPIKNEASIKRALDTNYIQTTLFYEFVSQSFPETYLVHFGTTFEYDLSVPGLTEKTSCRPTTYYGISKLLTSKFLLDNAIFNQFTIIRPFNLFGPYDNPEKIIPFLIFSQLNRKPVPLTEGYQVRDYFFVKDLSRIVHHLLVQTSNRAKVINAGSGQPIAVKDIATNIAKYLPDYDPSLWQWGKLAYGQGKDSSFFNASTLLKDEDLVFTEFDEAIRHTVTYYCSLNQKSVLC